jgi:hypothetical protein
MWFLGALMLLFTLASCGKSESDAKADVDKIWAIYGDYYATLEKNKDDPAKGIEAGQAVVDAQKDDLASLAKRLNNNPNATKVLGNFSSEMQQRGEEEGKKWGVSYAKAGLIDKIQEQMIQMADAMDTSGGSVTDGKASSDVIDKVIAQTLDQLKAQKDNFKSLPATNRPDVLKSYTESLKQAGASADQIKDFESKAKAELGW